MSRYTINSVHDLSSRLRRIENFIKGLELNKSIYTIYDKQSQEVYLEREELKTLKLILEAKRKRVTQILLEHTRGLSETPD